MLSSGCGGDDGPEEIGNPNAENGGVVLPPLPDPNDIGSGIEDPVLRQYCLDNFDADADGRLSPSEAEAVTRIDIGYQYSPKREALEVRTLAGIGYFRNLQSLKCRKCNLLTEADLNANLQIVSIGEYAFDGCTALAKVVLPADLRKIGPEAFSYCSALTRIDIPKGVTLVDQISFYHCESLKRFVYPDGVTTIHQDTFTDCKKLEYIYIPEGVTTIWSSFYGCSSLTEITIPSTVRLFKESPGFRSCEKLKIIYMKPTTPPATSNGLDFGDRRIYVPRGSVDAYKSAKDWEEYAAQIEGYDY